MRNKLSYSALANSKSTKWKTSKRYLVIFFPVIFFFISIYFLFNYVEKDVLSQISDLIQEGNYRKAVVLVEENLQNGELNRLKVLMFGSIASYLSSSQPKSSSNFELEDKYTRLLNREDTMKIYLEESYIRKFQLKPKSQLFASEFCRFLNRFSKANYSKNVTTILNKALVIKANWQQASRWESSDKKKCRSDLFEMLNSYTLNKLMIIRGDKLNLRNEPSNISQAVSLLKKGTKVLKLFEAQKEVIAGKTAPWFFVLTEQFEIGYIFSAYVGVVQ